MANTAAIAGQQAQRADRRGADDGPGDGLSRDTRLGVRGRRRRARDRAVGQIYRLQAAFHRAKSTQDIDLMMSL